MKSLGMYSTLRNKLGYNCFTFQNTNDIIYSHMLIYKTVVLLFFTNKLQHMNDLQVLYYPYSFLYLHTYVKQHDVLVTQSKP